MNFITFFLWIKFSVVVVRRKKESILVKKCCPEFFRVWSGFQLVTGFLSSTAVCSV
jgi:hypothetical protein